MQMTLFIFECYQDSSTYELTYWDQRTESLLIIGIERYNKEMNKRD